MKGRWRLGCAAAIWAAFCPYVVCPYVVSGFSRTPQDAPAPIRVLLDASPRAVEYQIGRLSNDELARVERRDDDPRYRPIYVALLTRPGLARELREEAVEAIAGMEGTTRTSVLLAGLTETAAGQPTADRLATMVVAQPIEELRTRRDLLMNAAGVNEATPALRAAYGALMLIDGAPYAVWELAESRERHLLELLRSAPLLPAGPELDDVRAQFAGRIDALLSGETAAEVRAAALDALVWLRQDARTFQTLARELTDPPGAAGPESRAAAVGALQRFPERAWPAAHVEPLARALLELVRHAPPDQRTVPPVVDAIALAERLVAALPDDRRPALRRELRAVGVQVVAIETIPEQMLFSLKWFAVEAGKPVQIVLSNADAMPHNLLVAPPGSLQTVAMAAAAMALPADPAAKPYVPPGPLVLQATGLLNEGETARLTFTAPRNPGEYVYVCTFPGHWVRMYGVMLVVPDLEAWEAAPVPPADPMTGQPFASRRN
jgi:azurin